MKNVNYFADFETSYINENQLNLPNQERERYVYLACLKRENESDDINSQENIEVFANGKDTLKNFIDRIIHLSEEHYINNEQMVIHFQNLKYDWSYIVYYLNVILNASNRGKTNGLSYTTIEDGVNLYSATIYNNGVVNKQKVRREKRKSNIPSDEDCEKYNIKIKQQKDYTEISFPKYYSDGEKIRDYKIKSKIIFYDTLKLFPKSVKALGKAIGLPKLDEENEFDYNQVRDYNYKVTDKEIEYCVRDVDIIERFYHLSPAYAKVKFTIASNTMKFYKDLFPMKINGKIYETFTDLFPNSNYKNITTTLSELKGKINEFNKYSMADFNEMYNSGYTGGITQVNKSYEGVFLINNNFKDKDKLIEKLKLEDKNYMITKDVERVIDVNSLYPFTMKKAKIPYGYPLGVIDFPKEKEVKRLAHKDNCVCICKIEDVCGFLKNDKLPIIPKNRNLKRSNLSNYYSELYHKSFIVNYEEFELYKDHYNIESYKITQCVVLRAVKGEIFEDYINYFYKLKQEATLSGDEVLREISKLFQNSLYGKFGTNPKKDNIFRFFNDNINKWDKITNEEYYFINENGEKQFCRMSKEADWIYPFVALCITSYARMYLIDLIDKIPYQCFLYCDTDSIHFIDNDIYGLKDMIKDNLIHNVELGKYDNEDNTMCSVYLAPKKYAYYSEKKNKLEIKCAGLPEDAKKKITTIEQFYYGYSTSSKLVTCRCKGGIDLVEAKYQIMKKDVENLRIFDISKNTIYI